MNYSDKVDLNATARILTSTVGSTFETTNSIKQ
jgi:hypothetical protein